MEKKTKTTEMATTPKTDPERSRTMRAVKGENTSAELLVRRLLHLAGYRFRLHRKDLPGRPDVVFPGRKKVVFVNGCFWHGHGCPRGSRVPKSNRDYWVRKIGRNVERDAANIDALEGQGWNVLTLWECELKDSDALARRLGAFLGKPGIIPHRGAAGPSAE